MRLRLASLCQCADHIIGTRPDFAFGDGQARGRDSQNQCHDEFPDPCGTLRPRDLVSLSRCACWSWRLIRYNACRLLRSNCYISEFQEDLS